jgi:hypothetical protein
MTAMITARASRILLPDGSLERLGEVVAGQREEHHDQHDVHDGAREGVHADRCDAGRGAGAALLQEPGVQRHPADVGWRYPVDE